MGSSIKKNVNTNLKFVYSENNSLSVIFQNNDLLMGIAGEFNENLKKLEKIFNLSQSDIELETISNNEFLTKGKDINKIDILFKKIEKKND